MRIHYILFLAIGILLGCKPEPKIPKWDVEVLAPLIHSRLDISDLAADSSLAIDADGAISLIYQNQLAELKPDEIFTPLNETYENTINLNSIDFGTRVVKDFVSLGSLAKGGSPAGQFIIFNNGNQAVVPPIPPETRSFNVDATSLFQTVTLSTGTARLELKNELPVPLTNIDFTLENKVSQTPIITKVLDTLKSGETYSEFFPLNNLTIEGVLTATLKNFDSPGSGTQQVLIDTTDQIKITFTLSDLVPTSATAIFPSQDLANDTTDTSIPSGNSELTSIKVKEGKIFLDATSTIEDIINLDYSIPNAQRNNILLSFNEILPAAPTGSSSNSFKEIDLADHIVDLTGRDTDVGVYNSFYTVLRGRIDSSGNLVSLSLKDSVLLKTGIIDLIASEGYGYLGKDTIEGSETSEIDIFNPLIQGSFDLADVRLGLEVRNSIGAPIDIRLNNLRAERQTGSVILNWTSLGQDQTIPSATLNSNNLPSPGILTLDINSGNSNIDKLVENQPENFFTDFSAFINGSTNTPDYNQFIFSEYGIEVFLNMEIPLNFSASGIMLADTNDFDYTKLDPDDQLQSGIMKLIADNSMPLESTIEIIMLDAEGEELGKLTSADKIASATIDANGVSIDSVRTIADYPLTKEDVSDLRKTDYLVFQVILDTPLPPQKVKLYQKNSINITLSGDLTIRTK